MYDELNASERSAETSFELSRGDVVLRGTARGRGPAVIFLHAGGERRQVWTPVVDELLSHVEMTCVAVDQRGHGASSGAITGLNDFGADAAAIAHRVGRPVVLVGTSLGGYASIAALIEHAAPIVGIVLVDVVPNPNAEAVWAFLERSGLLPAATSLAKDILGRRAELRTGLKRYPGRVMLVRGNDSPMTNEDVERFRQDQPTADVEVIPLAGHLVARDQPDVLGRLLARTLPNWFPAAEGA